MYKTIINKVPCKWLCFVIPFFLLSYETFSQSDFRTDNDYNRNASSLVFAVNTNGYRIGYRYSKRINALNSRLYDIEFAWYQHYKEKTASLTSYSQFKYTYGKLNQLMTLRVSVGKEKERYQKFTKSGIAILFSYNAGLSIGILKPYYLIDENNNNVLFKDLENLSTASIQKRAPLQTGFDKSEFAFGGHLQAAVSFNINKRYQYISRLELGATLDIFHRKLPILSQIKQHQYIATLFIAYRFGKKKEIHIIE